MKRLISSMILIGLFSLLAACGSGDDETDNATGDSGDASESTNLYDQIMEEGELTVGTEGTYAPFTFHNEDDELTGYDVEVIREVADRMGVEVTFEETQWDSMFAGLNAGRFDVIANQVGIDEDRLENYDFSMPYTYTSAVVAAPEQNDSIDSFDDIEGMTSAQSLTSNFEQIAKDHGAEIENVEGLAQAAELLKQGRVDVTVNDRLAVLDYIQQEGSKEIEIVAEQENATETAFTFTKGNEELVEAVNEQLTAMKEDGTLSEIATEWFGENVSSK